MKQTPRSAWRAWRGPIADRLDRRTVGATCAFAAFLVANSFLTGGGGGGTLDARRFLRTVALQFTEVTLIVLALAIAMVAVARGVPRWVAYAPVLCVAAVTVIVCGLVFDPNDLLYKMTDPRWVAITYLVAASLVVVPAVVYVVQSNAAQSTNALRRLETERAAEAERLAHQRLQAQLATIDHDLVLTALRLARASPTRAEILLAALSAYLRAAQQRESTDAAAVATTLADLRTMCTSPADETAHGLAA